MNIQYLKKSSFEAIFLREGGNFIFGGGAHYQNFWHVNSKTNRWIKFVRRQKAIEETLTPENRTPVSCVAGEIFEPAMIESDKIGLVILLFEEGRYLIFMSLFRMGAYSSGGLFEAWWYCLKNPRCASKCPRRSKALTVKCHCLRRRDFIFTFITFELYMQKLKGIPFMESTDNFL